MFIRTMQVQIIPPYGESETVLLLTGFLLETVLGPLLLELFLSCDGLKFVLASGLVLRCFMSPGRESYHASEMSDLVLAFRHPVLRILLDCRQRSGGHLSDDFVVEVAQQRRLNVWSKSLGGGVLK